MSDAETAGPGGGPPAPGRDRRGALAFGGLLLLALIAVAVVLLVAGDDDEGEETAATGACEQVAAPEPKDVNLEAPKAKQPSASAVLFETSCGSFTVALDAARASRTAASFQHLAEEGVFDATPFHRVVPGFVIQGGDPSGDGTGGPGYSITERPPRDLAYTRGIVAMAKTDAEAPGTSGSQFFVVTSEADAGLPPDFALVGEVSEGMDTVLAIEALGTQDGPPSQPVVINRASVQG